MGKHEKEIEFYNEAMDFFRRFGDRERYALVMGNIGNALVDMGKFREASEHLEEALKVDEKLKKYSEITWIKALLGEISLILGSIKDAERFFRESYELIKKTGNNIPLPSVLKDMGVLGILLDKGDAEKLLNESAHIYGKRENYVREDDSMGYLVLYYLRRKEMDRAREKLKNIKNGKIGIVRLCKSLLDGNRMNIKAVLRDIKRKSIYEYLLYLLLVNAVVDDDEFKNLAIKEFRKHRSRWAEILEAEK